MAVYFSSFNEQKESGFYLKGGKIIMYPPKKSPPGGDEIIFICFMQPFFLFFASFGLLQIQVPYQNFLQMILRNALQKNHAVARAL